ncbi:MAG TPA: DinB family protein [Bacteroidia bacterium]
MNKPHSSEHKPYFDRYIKLVPDGDFMQAYRHNSLEVAAFFQGIEKAKHNYRYAEGKWTVKDVLMHIIDTERVMSFRVLVAVRGDNKTPLQPVDEDLYAANVDVSERTMNSLVDEFLLVRKSTELIFEHITEEQSKFLANGVDHPISARAIGYLLVGHTIHHMNVVKERYL